MDNVSARMVFENAKAAIMKAFPGDTGRNILNSCKLTPGIYRFEQPIVAGQTQYTFPVLVNQGNPTSTEQRLNLQDSAVVYQIGIFTGAPASAGDGSYILDSYPNPIKYPTVGAAVAMGALYNGTLQITVNNDIIIPVWDIWQHYNAPETQATAAPGAGSPIDEIRGSFDGFNALEPNVTLLGSKNNSIQINLPALGIATIQANSRIVIMMRAIVAQNSTVVS